MARKTLILRMNKNLVVASLIALGLSSATAFEKPPRYPVIDGKMDATCWSYLPSAEAFLDKKSKVGVRRHQTDRPRDLSPDSPLPRGLDAKGSCQGDAVGKTAYRCPRVGGSGTRTTGSPTRRFAPKCTEPAFSVMKCTAHRQRYPSNARGLGRINEQGIHVAGYRDLRLAIQPRPEK
jgi:hypothetical protein